MFAPKPVIIVSLLSIYPRQADRRIGSNVIVAGTAIFGAPDAAQVITTLKSSVNNALVKAAESRPEFQT